MNPFDTTFLASERIAGLMRDSADIHRGPDRPGHSAGLATPATRAHRRISDSRAALASVLAVLRLTERT